MKYILTANQLKELDKNAEEKSGISCLALMENAANALKEEFLKRYKGGRIAVICGGGNNGGDGAAMARLLYEENICCDVYLFYAGLSPECKTNIQRLKILNVNIYDNPNDYDFSSYHVIIDALLGTGLNRAVSGKLYEVIKNINTSGAFVVSADIPSGLCADSGKALGICVKADVTVTFAAYKYGLLKSGINNSGEIVLKDIGVSAFGKDCVYEKEDVKKFFPERLRDTHKGSYGKLAIIAGSGKYFGAAVIAHNAAAALNTGAGLVTLCVPKFLAPSYRKHIIESTLSYFPDNGENALYDEAAVNDIINNYGVICMGMGMGANEETFKICRAIIEKYDKKLILDADALNSISMYDKDIFKISRKCDILITPHVKEFSRLTGIDVNEIKENPAGIAKNYSMQNNVSLLLKGAYTLIANNGNIAVNTTGTPAMAKAGSGDVLSGITGAIAAMGHGVYESGVAGAYIHGKAGEFAAQAKGEYCCVARDICGNIYKAVKYVAE